MRRKTTLSIEAGLVDRMKIQAVREKRDVSTITEELYAAYLKRHETFVQAVQKPKKR